MTSRGFARKADEVLSVETFGKSIVPVIETQFAN